MQETEISIDHVLVHITDCYCCIFDSSTRTFLLDLISKHSMTSRTRPQEDRMYLQSSSQGWKDRQMQSSPASP